MAMDALAAPAKTRSSSAEDDLQTHADNCANPRCRKEIRRKVALVGKSTATVAFSGVR